MLADPIGMACAAEGGVVADLAFAIKVVKAVVHELHSLFAAGLNRVFQLMKLVFTDQVADGSVGHQQFVSKNAA